MPLFDAYLMVDWSAAAVPTVGRDSIWYALRTGRSERCANVATRAAAQAALRALLLEQRSEGRRVLVGFDFPFGYPAGFAAALGLRHWRQVWRFLADHIADGDDNANDRFTAAARINRERFGAAFPFWGHPPGRTLDGLTPVKHAGFIGSPAFA